MTKLPVIIGFGGVNASGRSSSFHAYKRLVLDKLSAKEQQLTLDSLQALMALNTADGAKVAVADVRNYILENTLIRKISKSYFDVDNIPWNKKLNIAAGAAPIQFNLALRDLPESLPPHWSIHTLDATTAQITITETAQVLVPSYRKSAVSVAGQLPEGFNPGALYNSHHHPRGIQMAVFGASDAISSLGIDWDVILKHVNADAISVYAGSSMSQLDAFGNGGMMASRYNGGRVTSKQCPFGFAEMPADFINAYILGSFGNTGTNMGACASFLYNLRQGVHDIQSGRARLVIVGNSEAPILHEILDGYGAMGALASDVDLMKLDQASTVNHRRACRPFSTNCGFTIAESAQFLILCDDELALELGATIYGAVPDVFVSADGFKQSISSPGVGNYITVAKAAALAKAIVGEKPLQQKSYIHAHGTGTPQNRVTESHILNETAKVFGMDKWLVAAVKAYVGHSIGAAGGDQIMAGLGVWRYGLVPGIWSIDHIAADVYSSNLQLTSQHTEVGVNGMDVAFINAKGFGGNNASTLVLAPHVVTPMLEKKHGKAKLQAWQSKQAAVQHATSDYDERMRNSVEKPIYKFNNNVLHGENVVLTTNGLTFKDSTVDIDLQMTSPYIP